MKTLQPQFSNQHDYFQGQSYIGKIGSNTLSDLRLEPQTKFCLLYVRDRDCQNMISNKEFNKNISSTEKFVDLTKQRNILLHI